MKTGGSSGYLLGYGEEEGRKYCILSGIWIGRGEEVLYTYWDMETKRGGSIGYLVGYGGRGEEVFDT